MTLRRLTHAFTLIELLVVITIIVVLLALLAPALDRAVYEAQLAMCASNQHGVVVGAQVYAVDYKRVYPDRKPMRVTTSRPTTFATHRTTTGRP